MFTKYFQAKSYCQAKNLMCIRAIVPEYHRCSTSKMQYRKNVKADLNALTLYRISQEENFCSLFNPLSNTFRTLKYT